MMDCERAREEFAALLDGEMGPEERATVEAHLSQCSECLRELDGLKRVDTVYRQLPRVSAPDRFEERVRAALRPGLFVRLNSGARVRRSRWPVLAAAAAVLLVAGMVALQVGLSGQEHRSLARNPDAAEVAALEEPAPPAQASRFAPKSEAAASTLADDAVTGRRAMASRPADIAADASEANRGAPQAPQIMRFEGFAPEAPPQPTAPESARAFQAPPPPEAPPAEPPAEVQVPAAEAAPLVLAPAPMLAPDSERREVAGRSFVLTDGAWRQEGFAGEPVTSLDRDSEAFRALVAEDPRLAELELLSESVIFRHGDRWYELPAREGGETLLDPDAESSASGPVPQQIADPTESGR